MKEKCNVACSLHSVVTEPIIFLMLLLGTADCDLWRRGLEVGVEGLAMDQNEVL
jgi:hypothetical protein